MSALNSMSTSIQFVWITNFGIFPCTIHVLYQRRRLPQLSVGGLPEHAARGLKQKLDVVLYALTGPLEGRIHLEFSVYKENANLKEAELPCVIGILAAQRQVQTHTLCALGELGLDHRVSLSQESRLLFKREIQQAPWLWAERLVVGPLKLDMPRTLETNLMTPSIIELVLRSVRAVPCAAPDDSLRSHYFGAKWFESLPAAWKALAVLVITGGHHSLIVGHPGTGKSYFAGGLIGLLMDVNKELGGHFIKCDSAPRLVQPNTQATPEQLVYGYRSKNIASCWHESAHGIIWLDEASEFRQNSLESLRCALDPGEDSEPRIFIATTNPCPCGYACHSQSQCRCSPRARRRNFEKLSGPFLDRISIGFSTLPSDMEYLKSNQWVQHIESLSYADVVRVIVKARKKLHSWGVPVPQWSFGSAFESFFYNFFKATPKLLNDFHDLRAQQSIRRTQQHQKRFLTLKSLWDVFNEEGVVINDLSLEEIVNWDCMHTVYTWWGTGPVSYAGVENVSS